MNQQAEEPDVAVTFIRSGLLLGGQVHLARTWALVPLALGALSREEQVATLGAQYFERGIADGVPPATESYLATPDVRRPPVFLTTREVADLLRVSVDHVRRMVREGKLEAERVGDGPNAHMRFRRSLLTRWLGPHGQLTSALGEPPPGLSRSIRYDSASSPNEPAARTWRFER